MGQLVDGLWTRVICKQPGRYIGWPTIIRTAEGELLVVSADGKGVPMLRRELEKQPVFYESERRW